MEGLLSTSEEYGISWVSNSRTVEDEHSTTNKFAYLTQGAICMCPLKRVIILYGILSTIMFDRVIAHHGIMIVMTCGLGTWVVL